MDELTISNLDALGYHCEIGEQNAGIQLDALGKFLRYVAREAEKTNKELSDASTRVPLEDYLKVAGVVADSADMLDIPSWFDIPEAILATQQRLEVVEKQLATVIAERDTARSFISALVSVCDKNGTLPQWSTINLHNAKVALGQEAKLERQDSRPA